MNIRQSIPRLSHKLSSVGARWPLASGARTLGISIGPRSLWVAQVNTVAEGQRQIHRTEFFYPAGCTLEESERLGTELSSFLKLQGFSARRVIFAVPAQWIIFRPYEMPPTDAHSGAGALWFHATESMTPALGPMAFDYLGTISPEKPSSLLLLGLQERWIDQLTAVARHASLRVAGITPVGSIVGNVAALHVPRALIAYFGPGGMELIDQVGQHTRRISHLRVNGSPEPVIAQMRRWLSSLQVDDNGDDAIKEVVLWDDVGTDAAFLKILQDGMGIPFVPVPRDWIDVGQSNVPDSAFGLSALAICDFVNSEHRLSADFAHPRLTPPSALVSHRYASWIPIAVALAIIAFLLAATDLFALHRQTSALDDRLQSMQPAVDIARPYVETMQLAKSFRTTHPRYLSCLADVTQLLPSDGQTYLTSFDLASGMSGQISGTSPNQQSILDFRERMIATKRFSDLICRLDARQAHGAGTVLFTMLFSYRPDVNH